MNKVLRIFYFLVINEIYYIFSKWMCYFVHIITSLTFEEVKYEKVLKNSHAHKHICIIYNISCIYNYMCIWFAIKIKD